MRWSICQHESKRSSLITHPSPPFSFGSTITPTTPPFNYLYATGERVPDGGIIIVQDRSSLSSWGKMFIGGSIEWNNCWSSMGWVWTRRWGWQHSIWRRNPCNGIGGLLAKRGGALDWHEFERGLISLYDSTKTLEYAGKLSKLKQEGNNYDDYQPEFIRPSHHVHGLAQDYLISCFISGLRDQVKHRS